jgi:hypothetical protein
MGLTSGSFAVLVFVLAGAGLLAVVVCWPLAARRRVGDIVARVAMIAVSQVLVIAAFLVFMNDYFGFYATWASMLGSPTIRIVAVKQVSNPNAALVKIDKSGPAPAPGARIGRAISPPIAEGHDGAGLIGADQRANYAVTGELLQVTISGAHTGILESSAYVYLPPQYFQPAYAHAKFPAVLALTGYPGVAWNIVQRLKLPSTQATLVGQGQIRPVIDVIINASVAMPRDFECTNVPAGPQVQTFFAVDVPLAVERAFRVQSGPHSWAALGYSTGGLCAVKIAMMNPTRFSLAVSLAGNYTAIEDYTTGSLYGNNPGYRDLNSPVWRLQHLPAPPISALVTSSLVGETSYNDTVRFVKLVHPPMRVYTEFLHQGGHNYGVWAGELPLALRWLDQRLTPALAGLPVSPAAPVKRAAPTPRATKPAAKKRPPVPGRPVHHRHKPR